MTYPYENTSPERFQQFCQALLLPEFPGLQCFPVGQPDGGRDAWHEDSRTVMQVKFRRSEEKEAADWMISALEGELPKIRALIDAGAKQYIMVTNARGTAHLEVGRIDLVRKWMEENIECSAVCLWRDDLDRRLDQAPPTLKIKYPELLSGQDGIELALTAMLGPERERQLRVVRSFVVSQYEQDEKVKFKQVELSNSLSDLFIDIPLRFNERLIKQVRLQRSRPADKRNDAERLVRALSPVSEDLLVSPGSQLLLRRIRTRMGAAQFLLSNSAQTEFQRVVLEGGPGQGKSTLAQYVCQIHRARFLAKPDFLEKIPSRYMESGFRLPLKIDLRDLAAYISRATEPEAASIEEFASQLIQREAGGLSFAPDDFADVITATPTLLFLDGLDEVADLDQRTALIQTVHESIQRITEWGADLQVVVTSRPSVFGKKANFDDLGFVVVDLADIEPKLVVDYSNKWVAAKGLKPKEAKDVLVILRDKMEMPHIRELTRNAMQLTILLSLVHQIGYSLPDQRTDLYRRYLELFLVREAEKSPSVKRHAPVLVSFIQHLAWVLQSQAESAGSSGSITKSDLRKMAREYLAAAKEPTSLADDLFGGGLERIFVLVQRVSGLYEFEVQPLREFFCARHLYETSPVGTYRYQRPKGDRAQRFEAIALNPFWLNVTRFYAGSYEPGEIGSLVMSLRELIGSRDIAASIHGRRVAFALLSDWVFANKKSWQEELIESACDSMGLDLLTSPVLTDGEPLALDEACGQSTLRTLVFDRLKGLTFSDPRVFVYCALLEANGGVELRDAFIGLVRSSSDDDRTEWFLRMVRCGAADSLPIDQIFELAASDAATSDTLTTRLFPLVERDGVRVQQNEPTMQVVVRLALEGRFYLGFSEPGLLTGFVDLASHVPFRALSEAKRRGASLLDSADAARIQEYEPPGSLIPEFLRQVVTKDVWPSYHSRAGSLSSNSAVCEALRRVFGDDHWACYLIALRSAGIKTSANVRDADAMFDAAQPLCERARYARLKRGSVGWWRLQRLAAEGDPQRLMFWTVLALMWTSPQVFDELRRDVETYVDGLNDADVHRMFVAVELIALYTSQRRDREDHIPALANSSDTFALMLAHAFRLAPDEVANEVEHRSDPRLTSWAKSERERESLSQLPPKGASDARVLSWLKQVGAAQRAGTRLPYAVHNRCRRGRFSFSLAKRLAMGPEGVAGDAVDRGREIVMASYSPRTLTQVADDGEWTFE